MTLESSSSLQFFDFFVNPPPVFRNYDMGTGEGTQEKLEVEEEAREAASSLPRGAKRWLDTLTGQWATGQRLPSFQSEMPTQTKSS